MNRIYTREVCLPDIKKNITKYPKDDLVLMHLVKSLKKYSLNTTYVSDTVLEAGDIPVSQMGIFPMLALSFFPSLSIHSFPASVFTVTK